MITKAAKKKIKKELKRTGKGYTQVIIEYLKKNDIRTKEGNIYSESMIRAIMNRPITNLKLELAIYDCFSETLKENKKEDKRINVLLSQVK
ncbi:hypothetical protein I215_01748 [Galbibacter marinus]|uniref:Uncharacterized protein n=1 Tax=Galbibacter marinus TaxID=555500 RepID=K2Q5X9_9FLAO|nr:hypothetical protein [Galbibacter marinus]EKF56206.1 hypothetical protein I215_01748 [Galbibacter marinus]